MPSHEVQLARTWWDRLSTATKYYLMNKYQIVKNRSHHTVTDIEMSNMHILEEQQEQTI